MMKSRTRDQEPETHKSEFRQSMSFDSYKTVSYRAVPLLPAPGKATAGFRLFHRDPRYLKLKSELSSPAAALLPLIGHWSPRGQPLPK